MMVFQLERLSLVDWLLFSERAPNVFVGQRAQGPQIGPQASKKKRAITTQVLYRAMITTLDTVGGLIFALCALHSKLLCVNPDEA
jgi:hypothetical protein